jgi:hypothetical protein
MAIIRILMQIIVIYDDNHSRINALHKIYFMVLHNFYNFLNVILIVTIFQIPNPHCLTLLKLKFMNNIKKASLVCIWWLVINLTAANATILPLFLTSLRIRPLFKMRLLKFRQAENCKTLTKRVLQEVKAS